MNRLRSSFASFLFCWSLKTLQVDGKERFFFVSTPTSLKKEFHGPFPSLFVLFFFVRAAVLASSFRCNRDGCAHAPQGGETRYPAKWIRQGLEREVIVLHTVCRAQSCFFCPSAIVLLGSFCCGLVLCTKYFVLRIQLHQGYVRAASGFAAASI